MTSSNTEYAELIELAERCEKAEGLDRELDCLIGAALKLQPEGMDITAADSLRLWGLAGFARNAESQQNIWSTYLPRYTASIDAALTLVPEGLEWELMAYDAKRDPRFGRFQARIMLLRYEDDPEELGPQGIANGHGPALALCAAALRARSHLMEKGE